MIEKKHLRQAYARITGYYSGHDLESALGTMCLFNHLSWLFLLELEYTPGEDPNDDEIPGSGDT